MSNNDNFLDELNEIRNSFGDYCINSCKGKCCKNGKLLLQGDKEVNLFSQKVSSELIENSPDNLNNKYFNFEKNCNSCHFLDSNGFCKVYRHSDKPRVCNDFPIFKAGDFILTAPSCPAMVDGLVDDKLKKFCDKYGFKLV